MRPGEKKLIPNWGIGLIALGLTVFGFYMGFTKKLPFTGEGYQVKAVFQSAQIIREKSPVRIAGVNVGEVTKVEHLTDENGEGQEAALVTMKIQDTGRPICDDVNLQLRPRLFLEGNLFVDAKNSCAPGSEELDNNATIPLSQTSISVQLDQVLTSLQAPIRSNLQLFLKEFGDALERYGGAEGFRESFRTSAAAFRYTSEVNEALLGTEPGDLSSLIVNFADFARALNQDQEALGDLVTNLRIVTGSFAAERDSLELAIQELGPTLEIGRPALARLNEALPQVRAFAREALPGVRTSNPALRAAIPFIEQLRRLMTKRELRGLVRDLVPTVPSLAKLARATIPFFEQARLLSNCFNEVIIPWGYDSVSPSGLSGEPPFGPVYKETGYGLAGIAGESRSGDGNGQYIRVEAGGGPNTVSFPAANGLPQTVGVTAFELLGAEPAISSSAKTPFRPDVPCETQEPPNLNTGGVASPPSQTAAASSGTRSIASAGEAGELSEEYASLFADLAKVSQLRADGDGEEARELQARVVRDMQRFYRVGLPDYRKAIQQLTGVGG